MRGRGSPIKLLLVLLLFTTAVFRVSEAACQADTLTVIQRPLLNIPAIVRPGDALSIQCEADGATSGWTATLLGGLVSLPMEILGSSYNESTLWWTIQARVPNVSVYELYDLESDPDETDNLYEVEKARSGVLEKYLQEWMALQSQTAEETRPTQKDLEILKSLGYIN